MHPLIGPDATPIARDMPRAFRARDAHRVARLRAIAHDHAMRFGLALLLVASTAHATIEPPCKGCLLDVPKSDTPLPMLVVMHGDREAAPAAHARWRAAAKQRKWVLLSLDCPVDEGCTKAKEHSWWQWGGEPQWIVERVADVRERVAIDPARIYLAGWSGGATYLGMRAI